jgi:hypothetical protein
MAMTRDFNVATARVPFGEFAAKFVTAATRDILALVILADPDHSC